MASAEVRRIERIKDPAQRARAANDAYVAAKAETEALSGVRRDAVSALLQAGWSMQRVADELGITKAMVQKIESRWRLDKFGDEIAARARR